MILETCLRTRLRLDFLQRFQTGDPREDGALGLSRDPRHDEKHGERGVVGQDLAGDGGRVLGLGFRGIRAPARPQCQLQICQANCEKS